MVQFMPFSATPDGQGEAAVQAAIAFAKVHPLYTIAIDGFHDGQYANQSDTIGEQRVRAVVSMLVDGGIRGARISVSAQASPMPSLPRDTVKIAIYEDFPPWQP